MAVASFVMTSETLEVLHQRSIQSDMGFPKKLKGVVPPQPSQMPMVEKSSHQRDVRVWLFVTE